MDDVNLEETVPPAANFFKMFSSLIVKNSFWVLQKKATLKVTSSSAPQSGQWLTGLEDVKWLRELLRLWYRSGETISRFADTLRFYQLVIQLSDGQCSKLRDRKLESETILLVKFLCFDQNIYHSLCFWPKRINIFSWWNILWCSSVKCYTACISVPQYLTWYCFVFLVILNHRCVPAPAP